MTSLRRVALFVFVFALAVPHFAQESSAVQQTPSRTDSAFSDQVATGVLNDIRDGLEAHSRRLMLSAFDATKMDGYLTFEDQIQAYFEHYEGFRVHFRVIQATSEGEKGIVLAEFEIEGSPRGGGPIMRRTNQVRFELARGKKGWKIIDFRPRAFFA